MANFDFTDPNANPQSQGFNIADGAAMQQRIESLSVLMGQIETNFKNMGELLNNYVGVLDKSVISATKLAAAHNVGADALREQTIHVQKAIELENKRLVAAKKIDDLAQSAAKGNEKAVKALREQMREVEGMSKGGKYLIPAHIDRQGNAVPPRYVSANEATRLLSAPAGGPARQAIISRIAGGQNLDDSPRFHVNELVGKLVRGDIGGAVGELMQRGRTAGAVTAGLESAGLSMGGRMGGILTRIAPRIGAAFTPAGALGAIEVYRRSIRSINQTRDIGMITGQGFEEGASARSRAFISGLNPFDMISSSDALQAQIAMRQAGFRGSQANGGADLTTDLRQRLGLPIADSAALVVTALRNTNMSLSEARVQLTSLKDAARDAGLSVKEMATAAQTAMTALAPLNRGAAAQAIPNIEALTGQYRGIVPRQTLGTLAGVMTAQTAQTLAMRMGIPAWQALSPAFFNRLPQLLNQFILSLAQRKPASMDYVDYANFLFMADTTIATMFQSTGPQGLADLMKGISSQVAKHGITAVTRGQLAEQATLGADRANAIYGKAGSAWKGGSAARTELLRTARSMGLTATQIAKVIDPLNTALKGEDAGAIYQAERFAGRELGTLARHGHVTISPTPALQRWFQFGINGGMWNDVMKGRTGAQGVYRPGG